MRIDKYLKTSRIIKRRTVAKEACSNGRVKLNNRIVKASDSVSIGDILQIEFGHRIYTYKIMDIHEHVKKEEAIEMYEIVQPMSK